MTSAILATPRPAVRPARSVMRALPFLILLTACDGPSTTPAPAPAPSTRAHATTPTPAAPELAAPNTDDDAANFADPKTAADPPPAATKPADDPALAARIRERFGERCKLERSCGDLLGIDCQAAVDGPYYYVQRADLTTVSTCGGACMTGHCVDCPPKRWTCATY